MVWSLCPYKAASIVTARNNKALIRASKKHENHHSKLERPLELRISPVWLQQSVRVARPIVRRPVVGATRRQPARIGERRLVTEALQCSSAPASLKLWLHTYVELRLRRACTTHRHRLLRDLGRRPRAQTQPVLRPNLLCVPPLLPAPEPEEEPADEEGQPCKSANDAADDGGDVSVAGGGRRVGGGGCGERD